MSWNLKTVGNQMATIVLPYCRLILVRQSEIYRILIKDEKHLAELFNVNFSYTDNVLSLNIHISVTACILYILENIRAKI